MSFLLNFLLLVFGSVGAVAAFGGETWIKSDDTFWNRITKRGWVALSCLVLSFSIGVTKEIRDVRSKAASELTESELRKQLDDAKNQIDELLGNSREQKRKDLLKEGFAVWTKPGGPPEKLLDLLESEPHDEWDFLISPKTMSLLDNYRSAKGRATEARQKMKGVASGMTDEEDPETGINSPRMANAMKETGDAVDALEDARTQLQNHFTVEFGELLNKSR
jgi:hypothetical protein